MQTIRIDASDAIEGLKRLDFKFSDSFRSELGAFQIAKINIRTAEGKDWEGIPFKPYSDGYKKFKRDAGKPVNNPNLVFHDQMLASMNVQLMAKQTVRIGFPGTQVDKAIWNNATREFFRPADKDIDKIKDMVDAEVARIIRESDQT